MALFLFFRIISLIISFLRLFFILILILIHILRFHHCKIFIFMAVIISMIATLLIVFLMTMMNILGGKVINRMLLTFHLHWGLNLFEHWGIERQYWLMSGIRCWSLRIAKLIHHKIRCQKILLHHQALVHQLILIKT